MAQERPVFISGGVQKRMGATDKVDVLNLDAFTSTTAGIVPSPVSSTGRFLKDDGTWSSVSGAGVGDVSGPGSSVTDNLVAFTNTGGKTIKDSGLSITSLTRNAANGVAGLDATGRMSMTNVPAALTNAMVYQGSWNPATLTPAIPAASGNTGKFYVAFVASGTVTTSGATNVPDETWGSGDLLLCNGTSWDRIPSTSAVLTVNGQFGNVVLTASDIGGLPAIPGDVVGPVSSTTNNVMLFADASGKVAKDGGTYPPVYTGDVSVGGATATINNSAVTYAKMQNVSATNKVLGRKTAGSGTVEELSLTQKVMDFITDATGTNASLCAVIDALTVTAANDSSTGYAKLTAGKISPTVMPSTPMVYKGAFSVVGGVCKDATSTNIVAAAPGNNGWMYRASAAGTATSPLSATFAAGDWLISDGTTWSKISNTDADFSGTNGVTNGSSGNVPAPLTTDVNKFLSASGVWTAITAGDVSGPASSIDNYPAVFSGTGGKTLKSPNANIKYPVAVNGANAVTITTITANQIDIFGALSNEIVLTAASGGTINSFPNIVDGASRTIHVQNANITFTYNASTLITPSLSNYTTKANDIIVVHAVSSSKCVLEVINNTLPGDVSSTETSVTDGDPVVFNTTTGKSLKKPVANITYPVAINTKRTTLTAAATLGVFAATANEIGVSGATAITAFDTAVAGASRILHCTAGVTFTAGPNLFIPGTPSGQSYVTDTNDVVIVHAITTSQWVLEISRYNFSPFIQYTTAETIAVGNLVYMKSDGTIGKAVNTDATKAAFGYCVSLSGSAGTAGTKVTVSSTGIYSHSGTTVAGTVYYLDNAGGITSTKPSSAAVCQQIGIGLPNNKLTFQPSLVNTMTIGKSIAMAMVMGG